MDAVNPATGERIETYETDDETAVDETLDTAVDAFGAWRDRPLRDRAALGEEVASVLRERRNELAELMAREMGKPVRQGVAEIEKCAWVCEHYVEHAGRYLADEHHPSPPGSTVKTVFEPLGPVLAVMPWNFPFWQVFRFAAPNLAAGNVGLLKHASIVPGCATAIEEVFQDAGYPPGVFQSLLIPSDRVEDVIADERIVAATLTGSDAAGRAVAASAGEQLKKTVLELGGSDPFVVLDDADVEAAAETGAWARNQNGGQSCIAAKRFIVLEGVYEAFLEAFVEEIEGYVVGDPADEATDIGPQASDELLASLHDQVERSVDAGATVVTGGTMLDREGAFYPPTALVDVPAGCPVDTEEVFGPVAAVYAIDSEAMAVEKANDTEFGLGASVWTTDRARGERIASRIDAGYVAVNQLVKSDPRVPFGGIKQSGYGRELSEAGIKEFVNRKTVWVE